MRSPDKFPESLRIAGASAIILDLGTGDADVYNAGQRALKVYGRIDVLVNNAAYGIAAPVEELEYVNSHCAISWVRLTCLMRMQPERGTGAIPSKCLRSHCSHSSLVALLPCPEIWIHPQYQLRRRTVSGACDRHLLRLQGCTGGLFRVPQPRSCPLQHSRVHHRAWILPLQLSISASPDCKCSALHNLHRPFPGVRKLAFRPKETC